jgi:hypothetical protein
LRLSARSGPFSVLEIAIALARLPGRLERDLDEEIRIASDLYERYQRGEFAENEVLAKYGDPPRMRPLVGSGEDPQQLASTNMPGLRGITLWHGLVALDEMATRRYVKNCGLAGCERVWSEWFAPPVIDLAAETPRKPPRKRRDQVRPEIIAALPSLVGSKEWDAASDKQRCRIVDQHLKKSPGWCKVTTLRRAVKGYKQNHVLSPLSPLSK